MTGKSVFAHALSLLIYVVVGFLAALAYMFMHKHGLGRTGGLELTAVIVFLPLVALVGGVVIVLPLLVLHYYKALPLQPGRALLYFATGAFVLTFIWGGGMRIFGFSGSPPLIGYFMLAVIAGGGMAHRALAAWAWRETDGE